MGHNKTAREEKAYFLISTKNVKNADDLKPPKTGKKLTRNKNVVSLLRQIIKTIEELKTQINELENTL